MKNSTLEEQHRLQQNPSGTELKIIPLLLGNGKLAKHLHYYFHLLNLPHKHFENARDLESPELLRKLEGVNAVWILTSDRSIAEIKVKLEAQSKKITENHLWIHSSAATDVEGMITLHPLMTFGQDLYSLEQYQKIPFAIIGPENIENLVPFQNPIFFISPEQRALYHAYAVAMSNLPILLWSMTTEMAKLNLNLDAATFDPILNQTLANYTHHRKSALTGPIARNDQVTIDKNLNALQGSALAKIYESFLITKGANP